MRRSSTLVLVGTLAVIAAFAVADALRSWAEPAAKPKLSPELGTSDGPPALRNRSAHARELEAAHVTGDLFLADETCRVWRLRFPELSWVTRTPTQLLDCSFSLDPGGAVLPGTEVVSPPGRMLSASCGGGSVVVSSIVVGREVGRLRNACAPAWKPDGTLTYVRGGEIWQSAPHCIQCSERAIGHEVIQEVARKAGTPQRHFERPAASAVAWLGARRAVLVVTAEVREQEGSRLGILAFLEGDRLLGAPLVNLSFDSLRVSPQGSYVAARARLPRGLVIWDRDGRQLAATPVGGATQIAWSADERWAAVATGGPSVFVFSAADTNRFDTGPRPRTFRVPVYAVDLRWG